MRRGSRAGRSAAQRTGDRAPLCRHRPQTFRRTGNRRDYQPGGLLFANFIDFDSKYGHRRDVAGYAAALEAFDARLPELMAALAAGDLLTITADHGCDPTWRGTDHTRELVPILAARADGPRLSIGKGATFADVGASVARHLEIPAARAGTAFL